jgi:hypothetical protein
MRSSMLLVTLVSAVSALSSVSASAQAQKVMYVRPPLAVLCDRLDYAKVAVQVASEANRSRVPAHSYPRGCWIVKAPKSVIWLDQFDDYAYVAVESASARSTWARAFVHVGALSDQPEQPARRRR